MFCKNCGKEIADDTKFCSACGTPCESTEQNVEETVSTVNEEPVSMDVNPTDNNTMDNNTMDNNTMNAQAEESFMATPQEMPSMVTEPTKTNKKKPFAIIAAIIVVAICVTGFTARAQVTNFFKKTFSSPKSYYQYVEEKNLEAGKNAIDTSYKDMYETITSGKTAKTATYKIELGQTMKTMLSMVGVDFSSLDSAEISATSQMKDNANYSQLTAAVNGATCITLNSYIDSKKKEGYMQIPELNKAYLDLSKAFESEEASEALSMVTSMNKSFPEPKAVSDMYSTYTNVFIKNFTEVKKGSATVKVDGISQKCTKLTVTVSPDSIYNICNDFINEFSKDKTIKSIVENIDKDSYAEFEEAMKEAKTALKDSKDDFKSTLKDAGFDAKMIVYVGADGNIIGRDLSISMDGDTVEISSKMPQKGKKFTYQMEVLFNGTSYGTLTGKGTRKGGKLNGKYSLSLNEEINPVPQYLGTTEDLISIEVKDYDEDAAKDGYPNGTITLQCKSVAAIASYAIEFSAKSNKKESSSSITILCADDKLATLSVESKDSKALKNMKPSSDDAVVDVTDTEALTTYTSEMDLDAFLSDLQEKSGVDFSNYATMFNSLLGNEAIEDDYSTDEYSTEDYDLEDYDLEDYDLDEYDTEDSSLEF